MEDKIHWFVILAQNIWRKKSDLKQKKIQGYLKVLSAEIMAKKASIK